MDCTDPTYQADNYLACSPEIITPVLDVILPVLGIVILVAVLFAGIRVARKTVRAFGDAI